YPPSASETFIRAHIERLPADVTLIHSWRPMIQGRHVLSLPARLAHKLRRILTRNGLAAETTSSYVTAFRRLRTDAVLAEYGTTGVLTLAACRRLGLPLIVHFHGFDASVRSVLAENATAYPALLSQAAAVIAVSTAMRDALLSLGARPDTLH